MNELRQYHLFASPSFAEGVSRLFDWGDTLTEYNRSRTGQEADAEGLSEDWSCVGRDLHRAYDQVSSEPRRLAGRV